MKGKDKPRRHLFPLRKRMPGWHFCIRGFSIYKLGLYCHCEKASCFRWRQVSRLSTESRISDFLGGLPPYASPEAALALARVLLVKHSLPGAELLWQNLLFSCKIQKESLNSFAKVLSTPLKQEGSSQMRS